MLQEKPPSLPSRDAAMQWRHLFRTGDRLDLVLTLIFSLVFIVIVVMGAAWISKRSNAVLTREVRNHLEITAALAAMQFPAKDIESIDGPEDAGTLLFRTLVARAEQIRQSVPNLAYVYVMRRTENPDELAFVIENDMLLSPQAHDRNGDGTIEPDEEASAPGDTYDISGAPTMSQAAFEGPASDDEVTYDKWGTWISAYAPIRGDDGLPVAILGIDVQADQFLSMTASIVSPEVLTFVILGVVLVAGSFLIFFWHRRLRLLQRIGAQRIAMVTVASHKLGGPIATIRWWSESLMDGSFDSKEQALEAQRELANAVERLSDVTRHLEDATRVDGTDPGLWQKLAQETATEIGAHHR